MDETLSGKAWKFGENVDTDQIIPAEYLVTADPKQLALHAFEKVRPEFSALVRPGDIIVAGRNFGCGSSREHAPLALLGAGIKCVIAKSFARIFFRNSINLGLALVEADLEASDGEIIAVDFKNGRVSNETSGSKCGFSPPPDFLLRLIDAGGLIEYTKSRL